MIPRCPEKARRAARNRQRFYTITVTRTRFDGWALVRETGFETEGAARAAGERWRKRKEKRGYRAVIACREKGKGHADHD